VLFRGTVFIYSAVQCIQPVLMIKTKVACLEGRFFSSQSELYEYFLNCSDWLDKINFPKRPLCFGYRYINKIILSPRKDDFLKVIARYGIR